MKCCRMMLPRPCGLAYRRANHKSRRARRRREEAAMMHVRRSRLVAVALTAGLAGAALPAVLADSGAARAQAQGDQCKQRGQLDTLYCDEDGDLVADAPKDPKKWRDPG